LFYTTYTFSATEVETVLLHSGIISSDFVTSMPASLLAKNSSVSMDLMSNNTTLQLVIQPQRQLKMHRQQLPF
jgi:hypothetical protein